jgi:alkylation response protein AidB-like acyl-CoA dehydrogenase
VTAANLLEPLPPTATSEQVHDYVRVGLGAFFTEHVNPGAADRDAHAVPLPAEVFGRAADLGLLGFLLPREVGGSQCRFLRITLV